MGERIAAVIKERARDGHLPCAVAFRIAADLGVEPLVVGQVANDVAVRLARCQLGLFGYGEKKSILQPPEEVAPELEQAIREGLVEGGLPCETAWAIADRLEIGKLDVANAAEKLEVRIRPCQLGAF